MCRIYSSMDLIASAWYHFEDGGYMNPEELYKTIRDHISPRHEIEAIGMRERVLSLADTLIMEDPTLETVTCEHCDTVYPATWIKGGRECPFCGFCNASLKDGENG